MREGCAISSSTAGIRPLWRIPIHAASRVSPRIAALYRASVTRRCCRATKARPTARRCREGEALRGVFFRLSYHKAWGKKRAAVDGPHRPSSEAVTKFLRWRAPDLLTARCIERSRASSTWRVIHRPPRLPRHRARFAQARFAPPLFRIFGNSSESSNIGAPAQYHRSSALPPGS